VSEGCGGVNYVVAAVAVGYVYAGVVYHNWRHRFGFLVASVLVSLIGNGLRVFTTILLDHVGATRVAAGMGHEFYGLLVFAIMMSALITTCGRWDDARPSRSRSTWFSEVAVNLPIPSIRRTVLCAMAGMLLVAGGPVSARMLSSLGGVEAPVRQKLPEVSSPWRAVSKDLIMWSPRFVTPGSEFLQTYQSGDKVVKLYVASYSPGPGANVASRSNVLYEDPWWSLGERRRPIVLEGKSLQAHEISLRSRQSSLLVWSWYEVGGTMTGDRYVAKLFLAKARLFRNRQECRAIVVATPSEAAARVLREFVTHVVLQTGRAGTNSQRD
jgi:EpsI family protein